MNHMLPVKRIDLDIPPSVNDCDLPKGWEVDVSHEGVITLHRDLDTYCYMARLDEDCIVVDEYSPGSEDVGGEISRADIAKVLEGL